MLAIRYNKNARAQQAQMLQDGLKRAGVRLTCQRMEICREIAASINHPDAEAVFIGVRKRVPTISLDTVYRTLSLLLDLGLIGTLGTRRESVRFDPNLAAHHHFVCSKCGEAYDFYSEEFDRLPVPEEVQVYGSVQKTHVEISGICQQCLTVTDS